MTESPEPTPDAELIDPDAVPFTVEEVIAAHVLLGQPEEEAREIWTRAAPEIRSSRAAYDAGVGRSEHADHAVFGIAIMPDSLIALSLVSDAAAARVDAYRRLLQRHPSGLPAEERRRRERAWENDDRRWRSRRAELMRALGLEEP